jgi:AcrR family transcriptional regulator
LQEYVEAEDIGLAYVPPRRGRPRQICEADRRQILLDAAASAFVDSGYAAASMDDVARRAGMSKKTLYQIFDTKESLLAAVIAGRRMEFAAAMGDGEPSEDALPEEVLHEYLMKLARFLLAPRQAAFYRLVISEAQRTPEIARAFHQEGADKSCCVLRGWLARMDAKGVLRIPDPEIAAGMLLSMVVADLHMGALVDDAAPAEGYLDARVRYAVTLFLGGARPRNTST